MDAIIKPGPEAGGASVPLSQSWSDSLEPHIGRRAPGTVWESQVTRYTNTQNTNTTYYILNAVEKIVVGLYG